MEGIGSSQQRDIRARSLRCILLTLLAQDQSAQMRLAVAFLHNLVRRVLGEALGEEWISFDTRRRKITTPPLVRDLVCNHREGEIGALRIDRRSKERKPFLKCDQAGLGVHTA